MRKRGVAYLRSALLLAFILSIPASAQNEKSTLYGVMLDNSGSLRNQQPQVSELGEGVIKRILHRGTVALFSYTSEPGGRSPVVVSSATGWSRNEKTLTESLSTISVQPQSSTTIIDALYSIAGELDAKAKAEKEVFAEKVIILITDGEHRITPEKGKRISGPQDDADERRKRESRLIKTLKESGIKVYAVGLVRELDAERGFFTKSPRENAENFLRKLTKETGGRVVFPRAKKIIVDDALNDLFGK